MSVTVKMTSDNRPRGFTIDCDTEDGTYIEADVMQSAGARVACLSIFEGDGVEIRSADDLERLRDALTGMIEIMRDNNREGACVYQPIWR